MNTLLVDQLIIGVDFDGTITTEPDMGCELTLQPDCKRVLQWLKEQDVRLVLWTCRTDVGLKEAENFLIRNEMLDLFEAVNDNIPEVNQKYAPHVSRKLGADYYIDDKNLGCRIDWLFIEETLKSVLEKMQAHEV
ncbi:hypothetical protein D3C74_48910 [compost metagenome]